MERKILSETEVCFGSVNQFQKFDRKEIKDFILKHKNERFFDPFLNRFYDVKLPYHNNIYTLQCYLRDVYRVKSGRGLVPFSCFAQVLSKGENSFKRNHVNQTDLQNSSDITFVVPIQGDTLITIEYSDHRDKGRFWVVPFTENEFVAFNSDLDYYINKNSKEEDLIYLIYNFKKD
tara:strand:- start:8091 stop:8618 length:528 start_codon:yes stop_codon:yes gene_type:complete